MERATVRVDGVVQSVGFRPFVYRRAVAHDLRGTVRNLGDAGVRIELEGPSDAIDGFLADLRDEPPPLARVETVDVERARADDSEFDAFEIVASSGGDGGGGTIPPDTAICGKCLEDMRDPDSRYHDYWATSCLDCGPRYTVIESLPYDRPTTSMAAFPMCGDCRAEYEAPADRRYHAQTIACPQCGPTLRYGRLEAEAAADDVDAPEPGSEGRDPFPEALSATVDGRPAIEAAAADLADGGTVVLKGIGGAHLACDATDPEAVRRLRERTGRPEKPFAVMAPDLEAVEAFADLSEADREALGSQRRPIVLVERRDWQWNAGGSDDTDPDTDPDNDSDKDSGNDPDTDPPGVAPAVAPGLHTAGVMLPYSGVHYLLFDHVETPLVMTSANLPGRPMLTANGPLVAGLPEAADAFLLHDRRIVARCDDALARVVDGERRHIRRSRGYAPTPVTLPGSETSVLSVGPELDVTAGVLEDGDCFLTQYVGDVDNLETFGYLRDAVDHLLSVTGLERPRVVARDAHPEFNTTDYARRLVEAGDADREVAVQHHHAHAASVLAEHDRDRAIAIAVDGVGYGSDGTVWGGEVLDASRADFERVGGLRPVPMPGGDRATRHPSRLAAGLLYADDPDAVDERLERHGVTFPDGSEERGLVRQQLDAGVNTPETSSAGRFLDAVSAALGVCTERTYEGEPAMKLEAAASRGEPLDLDVPRTEVDGRPVVDTPTLFSRLLEARGDGDDSEDGGDGSNAAGDTANATADADIAATAQEALATGLATLAVEAADERGRDAVALSGGVAYNDHVARRIREIVTDAGLTFLGNERVPPGDGGIAYGQAAVADANLR